MMFYRMENEKEQSFLKSSSSFYLLHLNTAVSKFDIICSKLQLCL